MKLSYKLLLSVLFPLTVFFVFIFINSSITSNRYLFTTFKEKHLNELTLMNEKMNQRLNEVLDILTISSEMVRFGKKNRESNEKVLTAFLKRVPEIERLSLFDQKGKLLAYSGKSEVFKEEVNVSDEKWFVTPLQKKKAFINNIYSDVPYDSPEMFISIPVLSSPDTVKGVLVAELAVKSFYSLLGHYLPEEGVVVLLDLEIEEPIIRQKSPADLRVNCLRLIQILKDKKDIMGDFAVEISGLKYTAIFKKISLNGTAMSLMLLKSDRTLYSFQWDLLKRHFVILLLGLVFTVLFIVWRIQNLTKPLMKLITDVNRLTDKYSKDGSVALTLLDASNKDEISLLNDSFLMLKTRIDKYSNEIVSINETLGDHVEKAEGVTQNLEKIVNTKVKQIKYQVYHDSLTGLPNRRLFNDRLEMAIAYSARSEKTLAVLFLDLDDFKNINDSMGHDVGDMFLKEVSQRIKNCCREEDTVSRFGGDEFVIILPDAESVHDAIEVANRIIHQLSSPLKIDNNELIASTSIGITMYPSDGKDVNTILKNADMAMYSAKKNGKNKYSVFTKQMNDGVVKRIALERSLRKALLRDEFKILYQPKVDLKTGLITGTEALVRWQKDEDTLVSPGEFIFVAEESDIICMLGEWVLRKACEDTMKIHKYGFPDLTVAVNISARQFQDPDFVDLTKRVLDETGLESRFLSIEITENIVMNDVESAIETMKKLNNLSVKIAIDDFGTGYSSMNYLKRFPVHSLKIDRSFIKDIPENMEDVAIAKSIMLLAHSLYLTVIAEGVENWDHLRFLKKHSCDEIQGNFCSMPISAPEILQMLRKGPVLV